MVQFREKPRATFILLETFLNRKNSNWVDITQIIILLRVTINHKHFIAFRSFSILSFWHKKREMTNKKIYENGYTINDEQRFLFECGVWKKGFRQKTTTIEQKITESENDTLEFRDHTSKIKYLVLKLI